MKNFRLGVLIVSWLALFGCKQETSVPEKEITNATVEEAVPREKQILPDNVMDRLYAREELSNFTKAIDSTATSELLQKEEGPFTLLALLNSELDSLSVPKKVHKYLINKKVTSAMMVQLNRKYKGGYKLKTMEGEFLTVAKEGVTILIINKAGDTLQIVESDILASNGIIHSVSSVKKRLPLE